jgi:hypothetical protein
MPSPLVPEEDNALVGLQRMPISVAEGCLHKEALSLIPSLLSIGEDNDLLRLEYLPIFEAEGREPRDDSSLTLMLLATEGNGFPLL